MAISRMQEPRQLYGLGSLVKSIGKTVKKIVKSPVGKAALLGLGGYALGGGFGPGGFAFKNIPGFTGAKNLLMGSPLGFKTAGDSVARGGGIFNAAKNFLGSTAGKFTLGAVGSILAASGMSPEEIEETKRDPEKVKIYLRDYYSKTNPDASAEEVEEFVTTNTSEYAVGGRVGLESGTPKKGLESISIEDLPVIKGPHKIRYDEDGNPIRPEFPRKGEPHKSNPNQKFDRKNMPFLLPLKRNKSAFGGRIGLEAGANKDFQEYLKGREEFNKKQNAEQLYKEYLENKRRQKVAVEKTMAANGGLMPTGIMKTNKLGIKERDYRETGGFVPVGIKEKADDVPAMLSKNEFVMTADAVRGMGGGNIEKGAQRLYDQMKTMEKRVV